jgi:hypothetical protein
LRIQINPDEDRFLLDHVVDGSPVLPTVMQLDLVARTLRAVEQEQEQPAGLLLRDISPARVTWTCCAPRNRHAAPRRRPGVANCAARVMMRRISWWSPGTRPDPRPGRDREANGRTA